MRSLILWACVILLALVLQLLRQFSAKVAAPIPTANPPLAHHAVIISIDGCRPDVLLRADTPVIHALLAQASFTFYAETTDLANTLPSHTSMLTGFTPDKHGITFNRDPEPEEFIQVPTLFDIAHQHGLTTGLFSTKTKFSLFRKSQAIDYFYICPAEISPDDIAVARKAGEAILEHKPGVTFVHLGNTDAFGHANGWGSPEQFAALHTADAAVGIVLQALHDAAIGDDTLIILSADHGGSGLTHGSDDPRSRYIPWIATGPDVRKDHDLTRNRNLTVHTEDTFATVSYFLGLPIDGHIDGRPVLQVLSRRELIESR